MKRKIRHFVHEALLSVSIVQLFFTPYQLFILHLTWTQYGLWCLTGMPVSIILGPLIVEIIKWLTKDD